MDRDGNGWLDMNDIKGVYTAKSHPDVLAGRKSEEQILMEFLETFEVHHSIRNNDAPDHIVTKEEFEEYYNNISASIDDDKYFEVMMNNAWKMNEADKTYGKGWTNKAQEPAFPSRPVSQMSTPVKLQNPSQTSAAGSRPITAQSSPRQSNRGGFA